MLLFCKQDVGLSWHQKQPTGNETDHFE